MSLARDIANYIRGIFVNNSTGNVGIGTSSPATKLHVVGTTTLASTSQWFAMGATLTGSSYGAFYKGGTTTTVGYIGTDGGGILGGGTGDNFGIRAEAALLLMAGGSERARIDSSGNLLVGTTSGTINSKTPRVLVFQTASQPAISCYRNTTAVTNQITFHNPNGEVGSINTENNTTGYLTSSDYRLKKDVQSMTGALAKVAALRPVTYKWKSDDSDGQGFIAHELQAVCPDAVSGEKDAVDAEGNPQYQGIDVSFLVATLTAAIQEQQSLITALTARVQALEASNAQPQ